MELTDLRTSAIITVLGSILFLIAAFLPVAKVYVEPDPQEKINIINSMHTMWNVSSTLFGLGSLLTAAGLGLVCYRIEGAHFTSFSLSILTLIALGAVLWSWHVTERIISPEGFATGQNTPYLFVIYSFMTQVGLFLFGLFLMGHEPIGWPVWMFMIGAVALFALFVIFKDMPPFSYYLLTLIFGVYLLVKG